MLIQTSCSHLLHPQTHPATPPPPPLLQLPLPFLISPFYSPSLWRHGIVPWPPQLLVLPLITPKPGADPWVFLGTLHLQRPSWEQPDWSAAGNEGERANGQVCPLVAWRGKSGICGNELWRELQLVWKASQKVQSWNCGLLSSSGQR